jgi:hypothetical protein
LRYESEMNRTIPAELAVLCLYDLNRFSAGVLVDVVQTRPRALINEMIIENPYYTEPGAYLARRKSRGLPGIPTSEQATAFLDGTP